MRTMCGCVRVWRRPGRVLLVVGVSGQGNEGDGAIMQRQEGM